jgi:hypothetical protein
MKKLIAAAALALAIPSLAFADDPKAAPPAKAPEAKPADPAAPAAEPKADKAPADKMKAHKKPAAKPTDKDKKEEGKK